MSSAHPLRCPVWILMNVIGLLFVCGCSEEKLVPVGRQPLKVSGETVYVDILDTPEARNRGFMHQSEIPEDQAKLFVFDVRDNQNFWMKNCPVPIDIAYIDDNFKIVSLYEMKVEDPGTPDEKLPRYESLKPVRYALEFRGGWYRDHGVEKGDTIDLSPVLPFASPR